MRITTRKIESGPDEQAELRVETTIGESLLQVVVKGLLSNFADTHIFAHLQKKQERSAMQLTMFSSVKLSTFF